MAAGGEYGVDGSESEDGCSDESGAQVVMPSKRGFQAFQKGAGGHSGKYAFDVSVLVLGSHRPCFYTAVVSCK